MIILTKSDDIYQTRPIENSIKLANRVYGVRTIISLEYITVVICATVHIVPTKL